MIIWELYIIFISRIYIIGDSNNKIYFGLKFERSGDRNYILILRIPVISFWLIFENLLKIWTETMKPDFDEESENYHSYPSQNCVIIGEI